MHIRLERSQVQLRHPPLAEQAPQLRRGYVAASSSVVTITSRRTRLVLSLTRTRVSRIVSCFGIASYSARLIQSGTCLGFLQMTR